MGGERLIGVILKGLGLIARLALMVALMSIVALPPAPAAADENWDKRLRFDLIDSPRYKNYPNLFWIQRRAKERLDDILATDPDPVILKDMAYFEWKIKDSFAWVRDNPSLSPPRLYEYLDLSSVYLDLIDYIDYRHFEKFGNYKFNDFKNIKGWVFLWQDIGKIASRIERSKQPWHPTISMDPYMSEQGDLIISERVSSDITGVTIEYYDFNTGNLLKKISRGIPIFNAVSETANDARKFEQDARIIPLPKRDDRIENILETYYYPGFGIDFHRSGFLFEGLYLDHGATDALRCLPVSSFIIKWSYKGKGQPRSYPVEMHSIDAFAYAIPNQSISETERMFIKESKDWTKIEKSYLALLDQPIPYGMHDIECPPENRLNDEEYIDVVALAPTIYPLKDGTFLLFDHPGWRPPIGAIRVDKSLSFPAAEGKGHIFQMDTAELDAMVRGFTDDYHAKYKDPLQSDESLVHYINKRLKQMLLEKRDAAQAAGN
jgi:hypothetical protein